MSFRDGTQSFSHHCWLCCTLHDSDAEGYTLGGIQVHLTGQDSGDDDSLYTPVETPQDGDKEEEYFSQ